MQDQRDAEARAAELSARYGTLDGAALLRPLIEREFPGLSAAVSAFGAESALLLSLVSEVNPSLPVIFLETGKHFKETRQYRDTLIEALGLEDVRLAMPRATGLAEIDRNGSLWHSDPDACCRARKVEPLERALHDFDAWITGRKRYQGGQRAELPPIEASRGRIKINSLATWSKQRVEAELLARGLPRHPLEARGYPSIGCLPCTQPVLPGQDARAGRWQGRGKTECGIHLSAGAGI